MLRFKDFLLEGTMLRPMTAAQWNKPNSQTRENRIDILKKLVKTEVPVALTDGSDVVFKNNKSNLDAISEWEKDKKSSGFSLLTKDGKVVKSGKIGKAAVFGGAGSGAGGGTKQTALAESLQCIYLACMLKNGIKDIAFFVPDELKATLNKVDMGSTSFNEAMELDASWHTSAYYSAIKIIKGGFANNKHVIHRESKLFKAIYAAKKIAFRNSDMPVLTDDKWNPGDIWAIDPSFKLTDLDTTSITALNLSLKKLFEDRKVVAISLKKVLNAKGAKTEVKNLDVGKADTHNYSRSTLKAEGIKTASFWRSKMGYAYFDKINKADIRTSTYLGSVNMEIILKTARGGRAGHNQIIYGAKKYMNSMYPPNRDLVNMAKQIERGDKRQIKKLYDMAKFVVKDLTQDEFESGLASADLGKIHSKLGATMITYMMEKNKGKKANDFITYIVNYAGSKSAEASVYLKVYE
jgi:hypothetical protein